MISAALVSLPSPLSPCQTLLERLHFPLFIGCLQIESEICTIGGPFPHTKYLENLAAALETRPLTDIAQDTRDSEFCGTMLSMLALF